MIIDSLPYLIGLIKQNIILQTIVVSGGFHNVDLTSVSHIIHSDQAIEFFNFPLDKNEVFDDATISFAGDSTDERSKYISIILSTQSSKYYDNISYYFGPDAAIRSNSKLNKMLVGMPKELGVFRIFDSPLPPACVAVTENSTYGYGIIILFEWNYEEILKIKEELDKAFESDSVVIEHFHFSS